jgi:hypothetical protein
MTANGWTCFHCGEHFPATVEGRAQAREHFGPSHAETYRRIHAAEQHEAKLLGEVMATAFDLARLRDAIGELLAHANVDSVAEAVQQLDTLRARLQAADAFSREVHRLRPSVWIVAMVDAHGPGEYLPPSDPRPHVTTLPFVFPPGTTFGISPADDAAP